MATLGRWRIQLVALPGNAISRIDCQGFQLLVIDPCRGTCVRRAHVVPDPGHVIPRSHGGCRPAIR